MDERKLQEILERLTESFERLERSSRGAGQAQERLQRTTEELNNEINAENDLIEAENKARQEGIDNERLRDRAMKNGKNALEDFTKSLFTTSGGMSKYGDSMTSAGDAAMNLGKSFGPLGFAIGAVVKALSWLATAALKQGENQLKAYDALAKVGVVGQQTTEDILNLGQKIGYASDDLERLTKVVGGSSTKLIALGTSMSDAVTAFGNIAARDEKDLAKYRALGISQDEFVEAQADAIGYLTASGQVIDANMRKEQNLRKVTTDYLDNLIELSAMTGENVDSLKKAQEAALNAANVQIDLAQRNQKQRELQAEANRLASSKNEEDKKQAEVLQKQADKMKEGTQAMNEALTYATQAMSPQQLAGLQSVFSTGAIVGENAAVLARSIPNITELVAKVKEGSMAPEAFMLEIQKSTGNMINLVGDAGKLSAETAKAFGLSVESIQYYTKMQSVIQKAGGEEKYLAEVLEKRRKTTEDTGKKEDALMEAENKRLEAERTAALKRDEAIQDLVKNLGVFEALGKVFELVTVTMNKFDEIVRGIITWVRDKASWMFSGSDTPPAPPAPETVTAHDTGGSIGAGQLGLVGEIGPELVSGPMQVTGRQQTADILQQAMQDYGQQQFQDLRNFVATSPAMARGNRTDTSTRSQQLMLDRQLQEIREEQENQYDYLLNFNDATLNLTDAFDNLFGTVTKVEDQLRSIFGTEDEPTVVVDEQGNEIDPASTVQSIISGVRDFFGMGTKEAAPAAPAAPSTPLPPGVTGLLEQISRGEGTSDEQAKAKGFKSGYDVTLGYGKFGGPSDKPLSEMTLGELKAHQTKMLADPKNTLNSSAAGKYQITKSTLTMLQRRLGLKDDEKFDAQTQDMLAKELLKIRGAERFLSGKMSPEQFQRNLAKEWASIAEDYRNRSYYGQHVGTTSAQIQNAMADFGTLSSAEPREVATTGSAVPPTAATSNTPVQPVTSTVGNTIAAMKSKETEAAPKAPATAPTPTVATTTTTDSGQLLTLNARMMGDLNEKLTSMISKIEESNAIMERIRVNTA